MVAFHERREARERGRRDLVVGVGPARHGRSAVGHDSPWEGGSAESGSRRARHQLEGHRARAATFFRPMTMRERVALLERRAAEAELGGGRRAPRGAARKGKLSARERLDLLLDEGSFVEIDRFVVHRSHDFGLEEQRIYGDGVVTGLRPHRRPPRLRLLAGLHRLRRLAQRGVRREDLQGDGPRDAERRAGHRPQRLRRRAHPGGRRLARRLRRHLPPQHARVRRRPADQRDPRSVRRRRGVLARDHRLHLHGAEDELHVRHRPERREDGHARRRDDGGARRRRHARRDVRRRALRAATRSRPACRRFATCFRYIPSNNVDEPPRGRATDPRDRRDEALLDVVPDNPNKPYDMHDVIRRDRRRRRRSIEVQPRVRGEHPLRLRAPRRLQRRHRRQPAGGARRRARHQRLDQGRAVHPLLRCVQHSAS